MEKDTQSRKWLLTFNNPLDKELDHTVIKGVLSEMKPVIYWVMSDEVGEEKTPHTHVFFACSSPVRFSTVKRCFPTAHIDNARGSCEENRAYVLKIGKWEIDAKGETKVDGTGEEWGTMPIERQGQRNDLAELYNMIESGMSNFQIISQNPDHILQIDKLERVRQTIREEAAKNEFRQLTVTYIQGETETGKTRRVMDQYGYENVYRVTNYQRGCYDGYRGQDIIVFEEFSSSIKIQDMLNLLDGYPVELPCRYINKIACYTKVYLISNIPLQQQYPLVRLQHPDTWQAFTRRIGKVLVYIGPGEFQEYDTAEYLDMVAVFDSMGRPDYTSRY
ncbi:replication protein [Oscillospiraceae bacterium OttesenSCG-928-F05]|nr:replication protein [Oscillospiraceae bacterium OttesenSCG-928-F05]